MERPAALVAADGGGDRRQSVDRRADRERPRVSVRDLPLPFGGQFVAVEDELEVRSHDFDGEFRPAAPWRLLSEVLQRLLDDLGRVGVDQAPVVVALDVVDELQPFGSGGPVVFGKGVGEIVRTLGQVDDRVLDHGVGDDRSLLVGPGSAAAQERPQAGEEDRAAAAVRCGYHVGSSGALRGVPAEGGCRSLPDGKRQCGRRRRGGGFPLRDARRGAGNRPSPGRADALGEPPGGLEPPTHALRMRCSTN